MLPYDKRNINTKVTSFSEIGDKNMDTCEILL